MPKAFELISSVVSQDGLPLRVLWNWNQQLAPSFAKSCFAISTGRAEAIYGSFATLGL